MRKRNISSLPILAIIILVQVLLYFYVKPHINQSDDIFYINSALSIIKSNFEFGPSVFSQRIGVFLPVSLSFGIFGVNVYSTTFYLLISAIFSTILIFFIGNKIKDGLGIIAAILFAFNPLTVFLTVDLLPDIFCSTLILTAIYFLFNNIVYKDLRHLVISGALFSLFLVLSFFVKEYLVFYLPFILFMGLKYYRDRHKFWDTFILTSSILALIIGLFYKLETGSFFYRLIILESEHNNSVWSFYFASSQILSDRILLGLYEFFLKNYEFAVLIIFSVSIILFKIREIKDESIKFWVYNFIILFIAFQYGSTSFNSYNPLPMQSRMFICLLPSMCILAAYCIKELASKGGSGLIYVLLNIVLIISLINLPYYYLSKINLVYFLVILVTLLTSFFLGNSQLRVTLLIFSVISLSIVLAVLVIRIPSYYLTENNFVFSLFVLLGLFLTILTKKSQLKVIFILVPVIFICLFLINNQKSSEDNTKSLYDNYISKLPDSSVVVMNSRSIKASRYYNFYNTNNLVFIDWDRMVRDSIKITKSPNVYLFVDFNKVRFLNLAYNIYIPKFINALPSNWDTIKEYRYSDRERIGLYKINSLEELQNFY